MRYHWRQRTRKKETWQIGAAHIKWKKSSVTSTVVSWDNKRAVYIVSNCGYIPNLRDFLCVETKLEQPEHEFCRQNKTERGQVQDWYLNEKMVVSPVYLDGHCCSSEWVGVVSY